MRAISPGDMVALLVSAVTVAAAVLLVSNNTADADHGDLGLRRTVDGGDRYASVGTPVEDSTAGNKLVVFTDFQCPFCRDLHVTLATLQERHPGKITVLYRHYPLAGHGYALKAAMASECAAEQGRFKEYATMLFTWQDSLARPEWSSIAALAGVPDSAAYSRCLALEDGRPRIEADIAAGRELGIVGTPTILFGERLFVGAPPLDTLVEFIGLNRPE